MGLQMKPRPCKQCLSVCILVRCFLFLWQLFYFLACIHIFVYFLVPPKITEAPKREDQLTLRSSSVQNHIMRCNASGDPQPTITWTKAGVPASQFSASGYLLHLVDVKREDAGSYICTASNGFGDSATAIGIVNIKCTCKYYKIGFNALGSCVHCTL